MADLQPARLTGARSLLAQAATNLLDNAIKFTQRGEVVVRVEREGPLGVLTVRDTGPGIGAAERALIFQEYRQARGEVRRRRESQLRELRRDRPARLRGGRVELAEHVSGTREKALAGGGHPYAPARSHEEGGAERGLQIGDLSADGGELRAQALRRPGERAGLSGGDECGEL